MKSFFSINMFKKKLVHNKIALPKLIGIAFLIVLCLILSCINLFSPKKNIIKNYTNNVQKDFDDYANELFCSTLKSDTLSLHFFVENPNCFGLETIPQGFGTFSYNEMTKTQSYYINEIKNLKSFNYNELLTNQKITYDVLLDYFKKHLDFGDLCLCSECLGPISGVQSSLPVMLSEYSFKCKMDITNYLKLCGKVKKYFEEICDFEKLKAQKNVFMGKDTCEKVINECENFIKDCKNENGLLQKSFKEKLDKFPSLNESEKESFKSQNTKIIKNIIIPSYEKIITTLNSLKSSGACKENGLYYLKNGKDYYEYLITTSTGTSCCVMELKGLIQNAVAKDMKYLYTMSSKSDSLKQAIKNEQHTSMNPLEIMNDLFHKSTNKFYPLYNINYQIKYVDQSSEKYLSPAFYFVPPIDSTDKNIIYINKSKCSSLDLYSTLAHEGVPGHMYQALIFSKTNPLPIRQVLGFSGYSEGWATYAESLSHFYKYKNKALAQFFSTNNLYSMGLCSLCDIGVNYEGWKYKDLKKFLENYEITDDKTSKNIFQSVIEEPGNYLKYYVGYLTINNIKNKMEKKYGKSFNLKKFHQAFLSIGPCNFNIVNKWIDYKYQHQ